MPAEELFFGCDVHKKSIVTNVKTRDGRVVDRAELGSSDSEFAAYLAKFPGPKNVVLEACCVWPHVYDTAVAAGAKTTLAHPRKVRLIAEASLSNDKVDAAALSELLRLNAIPVAYAPDEKTRALRDLVRERAHYLGLERSVKNHAYSVLLKRGIPYEDGVMGLKRRREELRKIGIPEVDRSLDALADLGKRTADLDKRIHEAFMASKDAQLLHTIPGIGELTAVILVAELCPITRFPNIEKAASYAGVVPTVHQSANVSYHGRMRKDCNHFLQSTLIEAAWAHRQWAPRSSDVIKVGNRVSRRRGKPKGSGAAAHQLLNVVYAVLKRGTPYTPERPGRGLGTANSKG
jgi:transposase